MKPADVGIVLSLILTNLSFCNSSMHNSDKTNK